MLEIKDVFAVYYLRFGRCMLWRGPFHKQQSYILSFRNLYFNKFVKPLALQVCTQVKVEAWKMLRRHRFNASDLILADSHTVFTIVSSINIMVHSHCTCPMHLLCFFSLSYSNSKHFLLRSSVSGQFQHFLTFYRQK